MDPGILLNWSLALVPVLVLLVAFLWLEVFKLVTFTEALALIGLGGAAALASYPVSGVFLDTLPIGFSNYSRFAAPWIEELFKTIAIILLFRFNRVGLRLDALVMGFAVGAGFAVAENILYLIRFHDLSPGVWIVRGVGTAIMHGATAAISAVIAHRFAADALHHEARDFHFRTWWFLPGYLVAVGAHMLFNQFPDEPLGAMIVTAVVAPFLLLATIRIGTRQAADWLEAERKEHEELLAVLVNGHFPDKPGWRRIQSLVDRSGSETASQIRDYVETLTRLILTEEKILLHETENNRLQQAESLRLLDHLESLRSALGSTTVGALTSILPFRKSDYWELWELHHHLRRRAGSKA